MSESGISSKPSSSIIFDPAPRALFPPMGEGPVPLSVSSMFFAWLQPQGYAQSSLTDWRAGGHAVWLNARRTGLDWTGLDWTDWRPPPPLRVRWMGGAGQGSKQVRWTIRLICHAPRPLIILASPPPLISLGQVKIGAFFKPVRTE
jgi:hypothetical protein